ncbi:hypothetical protein RRG08_026105 [Elysia crispata]|uniref:Uncharacterized protein n=1 Tax=Elysia crispata TaxID=231223 RepID=A0AAE1D3S9_9GAST|nr:hypothetical protein RRG08_026105 [Elysia crispata]
MSVAVWHCDRVCVSSTPPPPLLRIDGENWNFGWIVVVKVVEQKRRNRPGWGSLGPGLFALLADANGVPEFPINCGRGGPSGDTSLVFALSQARGSCRMEPARTRS